MIDAWSEEGSVAPRSTISVFADLGAGSGGVVRALPDRPGVAINVDLSAEMLSRAGVFSVCADNHRLPFADRTVNVVSACFGLNLGSPRRLFREAYRVIRPGGMLVIQEWGALDSLSAGFDEQFDTLVDPLVDSSADSVEETEVNWYDTIQYAEDLYDELKRVGFAQVFARESDFVTVTTRAEQFFRYKLAWSVRRDRWIQLADADQARIQADLMQWLEARTSGGTLKWSPPLMRACAIR